MKSILRLLPFLFFAGCATSNYVAYVGQQQAWPTAPGAFANAYDGVTIYHGFPPKPYDVLGRLVIENATDHSLAWAGKAHGADAIIVMDTRSVDGGSMTFGGQTSTYFVGNSLQTYSSPTYNVPVRRVFVTAWAIKFQTNSTTIP
ncbi:MAG: hypothetical protein ACLPRE_11805 [Limisphaerales bacterium]